MKAQYKINLKAKPRKMHGFGMLDTYNHRERTQTPKQIFEKIRKSLEKQYGKENVRRSVERGLTVLTVK